MDPGAERVLVLVTVLGAAFVILAQAYLAGRRDQKRECNREHG